MTIQKDLEAQLQQLGAKKVTPAMHPPSARWGNKYIAYTALSGTPGKFIFLGSQGAVRDGRSPTDSRPNEFLKEKLLARHARQLAEAKKQPKRTATAADITF